jgi:ASC-1-like (ASCH) protein
MSAVIHDMHVSEPWFSFIESGLKKIEGKKMSPRWKTIKTGDLIKFFLKEDKFFYVIVKDIRLYPDIESYLVIEGLRNTLPGIKTVEEGIRIYLQYFDIEEVQKFGIMAIEIEKFYF